MPHLGSTKQDMDNQPQGDGTLSGDWLRTYAKEHPPEPDHLREQHERAKMLQDNPPEDKP